MKLSQFEASLHKYESLNFELPDGSAVPAHFHVTEVGLVSKSFIDCGGTLRQEKKINFQLWEAGDYDHRLSTEKLQNIITLSKDKLNLPDAEIEVEYQGATIQKFGVSESENGYQLTAQFTDCLAKDNCGVPQDTAKKKVQLIDFGNNLDSEATSCTPGGGCC